ILWSTQRYSYAEQEVPELQPQDISDPRKAGNVFSFSGCVVGSFQSSKGMVRLTLRNTLSEMNIDAVVWPSAGKFPKRPGWGDQVSVHGHLGEYKGKPQIIPVAVEQVKVIGQCEPKTLHLGEASEMLGQKGTFGPVQLLNVERFTSKKGKQHLKAIFRQDSAFVEGIIYQGSWKESDFEKLKSKPRLRIDAKVGTFRNKISLTVKSYDFIEG
ncbi:MAG: hypothetical protein CMQ39_07400, partial [Gammaproteobacteria bacterium]|nr:hypothetical protein [Gammaproteobacteria bacterium]